MEGTKANIEKISWTERISEDVDIDSINKEKEIVIEDFEKVLNFLKDVEIKNEEDLENLKKPLNDLKSYLKYIPNGPLFNYVFPTEIKKYILSYLCDSNAFVVTSVCQEWKKILENGFKDKEVIIGKKCSKCEDEDNECEKSVDMFKTAAVNKLDVHLVVCKPVTEVDSKCITDGLTSVSKFTITNLCDCDNDNVPILSDEQFEHLFASMEKGDKVMEEVKLVHLDLNGLNQERLANCLINKIKRVTMFQENQGGPGVLDVKTFLNKIQQDSANFKLTHLTLYDFDLTNNSDGLTSSIVADALCNVENVKLFGWGGFMTDNQVMERLVEIMLQRPIRMKTLIIDAKDVCLDLDEFYNFGFLISPQDLTTLFNKMTRLQLEGIFTLEQLEAVRGLPDVEISRIQTRNNEEFIHLTKKGSSRMF